MKLRIWIYASILVVLVLVGLTVRFLPGTLSLEGKQWSSIPTVVSAAPTSVNPSPEDPAAVEKSLKAIFERLEKAGGGEVEPPTEQFLKNAVASGDKGKILRAFNEVIYHRKMVEVVPALKAFLNDPNPYVRYLAGTDLLIVGDTDGTSTLLTLVQSSFPIEGIGKDVRVSAAEALAKFGQTNATQAIYGLYRQTENGELIYALEALQASEITDIVQARGFFPEAPSIAHYGLVRAQQFVPQITATFYNTKKPDVRVAAAWALASITGDQNAINYLVQEARAGLTEPGQVDNLTARNTIKYLGTIQTPAAKQILELALNSTDSTIVQTAIVNLLYNQGGSDKAVQVIANQLSNSSQATLPLDFTLNIASQLGNNPTIQSAGQKFSQRDAIGDWQLYTVERKNWPINNWIGDYVLKLNK